ncbi:hypothetical protein [Photorhabdus bodei]|uniref:Uncharacterized protein n=1 Tax=Photorhabdus bodei TaxID=2029681 RepID=A0A329X8N9_9GAMM|nr:hypothetical protein [Photorhabdus bodei]RAX13164.1 hypothetical protein CKY02_08040 [Photorhabdus bodei]
MFNNRAVVLSILLSAANITGSSGLMIWVDTELKNGGMILNAYIPVFSYLLGLSLGCIPVILQVASLLAALTHPGHIVIYAPGDSLPCRRDAS